MICLIHATILLLLLLFKSGKCMGNIVKWNRKTDLKDDESTARHDNTPSIYIPQTTGHSSINQKILLQTLRIKEKHSYSDLLILCCSYMTVKNRSKDKISEIYKLWDLIPFVWVFFLFFFASANELQFTECFVPEQSFLTHHSLRLSY